MAIHPIEYRYNTPEMYGLFEEKNILEKRMLVEAALVKAHSKIGNVPKKAAKKVEKVAKSGNVKLKRVKEIESEIKHDLMAIVKAMSEKSGDAGKYIHLGATSYDIIDTAWALIFREALNLILDDLKKFKKVLKKGAENYKETVMIGRSHGQHGIPITLGFKFASWFEENERNIERTEEALDLISVGQLTGAVGTQASLGEKGLEIQKEFLSELDLDEPGITTQVIPRDRHAEVIVHLVFIAEELERIAKEIRNLQRPEILEIEEPFKKMQVGSSTMPQKRNPYRSERICGIARYLRGNVLSAFENIPLEHERDLTNSSNERLIFSETFILMDFILREAIDIVGNLNVYPENMQKNLNLTKGRVMAEAVMIKLVEKGLGRQEAHELIRKNSMKSFKEDKHLLDVLLEDKEIKEYLDEKEIKEVMKPGNYLGTVKKQIEKALKD
ncbi:MAG: adenylosuccinate lyase [Candidatus Undinarchaeales archaeon]